MKISPIEIRKYEFKKTLRGYDPDEVRYFLEMVADELEALNREKNEMESRHEQDRKKLEEYRQIEKSMQDALIVAKETSDKSLATSKKESKLIIADAEAKADRIVENARKEAGKIEQEIAQLRIQRDAFIVKLKNLLRSEFELLDALSEKDDELKDIEFEDIGGDQFDVDRLKEEIRKLNNDIYKGIEDDEDVPTDQEKHEEKNKPGQTTD